MIIKNELIKKVRHFFGLNIYESKVWLALLNKGAATAGEIAELSGVPRSRTYDVLEGLEKQGFAISKLGKPIKYLAVKPAMVLEKIRNNLTNEVKERESQLGKIKTTQEYKDLELLHKQGIEPVKAEELSSALRSRSLIHSYLRDMIGNANKEVILVTTPTALARKMKILRNVLSQARKHGVKIRIGAAGNDGEIKELSKDLGIEIKKLGLDARFCIVDSSEVLFMTKPDSVDAEEDTGIWMNSAFFASTLKNLFEMAWRNAR